MFKKYLFLFLLLALVRPWTWGQSQGDVNAKLSITTQMFLDEMAGRLSYEGLGKDHYIDGKKLEWSGRPPQRAFAAPDTIEGKAYILAFVRLVDIAHTDELEALGVKVRSVFKECGLLTALIPVDRVLEVAALDNVGCVDVSELMTPSTNTARQMTHAGDVLTHSAAAVRQGLAQGYDGTGVLLGILDVGIDFQHIAFKDSVGNSRIRRAYVYDGHTERTYTAVTSMAPTTDDNTNDHGTHTATTAGGSSVVVSGSTVTVTGNHAAATYGGMAPGASLYLAGVKGLPLARLEEVTQAIVSYADTVGMPVVVSNSWGSQRGAHDGTGSVASVYNSLFNDSHPNRIALFAASNDGGKSRDGEGGGYHVYGAASAASPLGTIIRSDSYSYADAGYYYQGDIANVWTRSTGVGTLAVRVHVLNAVTGEVLHTDTVYSNADIDVSDYYSGPLNVYYYTSSGKTHVLLYSSSGLTSLSYRNDNGYYRSDYTLAVEVYPYGGSSAAPVVDMWGGSNGYFTNHLTTDGHVWTAGSDDMSVSDEATIANVISVGAYVSKNWWTNYENNSYQYDNSRPVGEIAGFSSHATAEASPTGQQYPWITAPGSVLAAGVNHYHTTSVNSSSYYGNNRSAFLVVNNANYPYAMMQGTSMATPVAAGIVAQWLQQARENGIDLTVSDVKNIMRGTAIHDDYTTTGDNATHFGHGKINALGFVVPSWQGSGTADDPYLITTTEEMDRLACNVNIGIDYSGKYFRLANDIAYDTTTPNNYTPVGCNYADGMYPHVFNGVFDGYGNAISGIQAGQTGADCQGVFGLLGTDGSVTNLTVTSSTFAGDDNVGGIVGSNEGTVNGCFAKDVVVQTEGGGSGVGAVIGSSTGTLSGNYYYHCSLLGTGGTLTSGIGYGGDSGTPGPCDVAASDGAVEVHRIATRGGVTATSTSVQHDGEHYGRAGAAVGLAYAAPAGYALTPVATIDGAEPMTIVAVDGSGGAYSLVMSAADISVAPAFTLAVAAGTWHAVASPMHDEGQTYQSVGHVVGLTDDDYDLFYFNETSGTWINQKSSGTGFDHLQTGRGYIYRRTTEATLPFVGLANGGATAVGLTAGCPDAGLRGFNLIGNPYPHSVSLDRPYYELLPNGTWLPHESGGTLASGQAVLVYTASGESLAFTESGSTGSKQTTLPPLPKGLMLNNEDVGTHGSDGFAHSDGNQLVVEGNGTLYVFDVMGRQLFSHEVNAQIAIPRSQFPGTGVYLLRLVGEEFKTQRIVLN